MSVENTAPSLIIFPYPTIHYEVTAAFRDRKLPKLLIRPDIPEEDKKHLEFLADTKKWYPYVMRHPSLSKIAHSVNDYTLREHAGWTKNSDIVEIYTHTLTGDSAEHVLSCYGTNLKNGKKKRNEQLQQEMIGPHCPYCKMVNIPDSQFCSSCHRAISPVTYNKIMEDNEQPKKEVKEIRGLVYAMQETIQWFQKNGVLDPVTFLVNENNKRKSRERE